MSRQAYRAKNSVIPAWLPAAVLGAAALVLCCRLAEKCFTPETKHRISTTSKESVGQPESSSGTQPSSANGSNKTSRSRPKSAAQQASDEHAEHVERDEEMDDLEEELAGIEAEIDKLEKMLDDEKAGGHSHGAPAGTAEAPSARMSEGRQASSGRAAAKGASAQQPEGKPSEQSKGPRKPVTAAAATPDLAREFLGSRFADSYLRHRGVKKE